MHTDLTPAFRKLGDFLLNRSLFLLASWVRKHQWQRIAIPDSVEFPQEGQKTQTANRECIRRRKRYSADHTVQRDSGRLDRIEAILGKLTSSVEDEQSARPLQLERMEQKINQVIHDLKKLGYSLRE